MYVLKVVHEERAHDKAGSYGKAPFPSVTFCDFLYNITINLVPRAHVPFGQHQDTELWNNQFPETKILGLPVSQRMRGLFFLESRGEVDVNTFHKDIQYALKRSGN